MDWMERADRFTLGLAAFTDRRDVIRGKKIRRRRI